MENANSSGSQYRFQFFKKSYTAKQNEIPTNSSLLRVKLHQSLKYLADATRQYTSEGSPVLARTFPWFVQFVCPFSNHFHATGRTDGVGEDQRVWPSALKELQTFADRRQHHSGFVVWRPNPLAGWIPRKMRWVFMVERKLLANFSDTFSSAVG